jgi:hypothetical protein
LVRCPMGRPSGLPKSFTRCRLCHPVAELLLPAPNRPVAVDGDRGDAARRAGEEHEPQLDGFMCEKTVSTNRS